jgi:hypothetical protein
MKYNIIILLTWAFFSCNRPVKSDKKESIADTLQSVDLKLNSTKTDKLIGEWTICIVASRNSSTHYNVCPKVKFNNDGTMNNGSRKWKVVGKTLLLTGDKPDGLFSDSEYEMYYEPDSDFKNLTLTQVEKMYWITLGRN